MKSDEIRERIKALLKTKKMKAYELAGKLHVAPSTLSDQLNSGKRAIHIDDLPKFAEALGVSVYYLWEGHDIENRSAVKETGLSSKTITNIRNLDKKKKALLEMLVNDDGSVTDPGSEPEYCFMDALSHFVNDPVGNRIVEVQESPDDLQAEPKIIQAPHRLRIQLADGSLHDISEWKPDSRAVMHRLNIVREKYLRKLRKQKYIPIEEEGDDE